jgi:hypothetical protein
VGFYRTRANHCQNEITAALKIWAEACGEGFLFSWEGAKETGNNFLNLEIFSDNGSLNVPEDIVNMKILFANFFLRSCGTNFFSPGDLAVANQFTNNVLESLGDQRLIGSIAWNEHADRFFFFFSIPKSQTDCFQNSVMIFFNLFLRGMTNFPGW